MARVYFEEIFAQPGRSAQLSDEIEYESGPMARFFFQEFLVRR